MKKLTAQAQNSRHFHTTCCMKKRGCLGPNITSVKVAFHRRLCFLSPRKDTLPLISQALLLSLTASVCEVNREQQLSGSVQVIYSHS